MILSEINLVQAGKVVYVGSKPTREENTVKNYSAESLTIDHNGVVDNYHSRFFEPYPETVLRHNFTREYVAAMYAQGFRLFRNVQVYLLDLNLAELLKNNGITILPGDVSEQILIDGIDLNVLHQGSIISIGEEVELEVIAPRTYCGRFSLDLEFPPGRPRKYWEKLLRTLLIPENKTFSDRYIPVGVYTRVVRQGTVKLNDVVVADPTCSQHFGATELIIPKTFEDINEARLSWLTREQVISMCPSIPLSIIDSYYV